MKDLRARSTDAEAGAAARRYETLLLADPCNLEALVGLGRLALKAGQARQAALHLSRAANLRPRDPQIARVLGLAQASLGDLAAAAATFERALTLDPSDPDTRGNLGNVYKRLGRLDEAVVCYQGSLDLRPNSVELRINLAGVLIALDRCRDAATACRQALAQGPTPALLSKLVTLLLEAGDPASALQACERLKAQQPGWAGVLAHEGLALQELSEDARAQRLFDYRRFLQVLPIRLPPGTTTVPQFNIALARRSGGILHWSLRPGRRRRSVAARAARCSAVPACSRISSGPSATASHATSRLCHGMPPTPFWRSACVTTR